MSLSNRRFLCFIFAFAAGSVACELLSAEDKINWAPDLATASQEATRSEKLLLLHFYADNCPPCRRLEKNVFSQTSFANNLSTDFVPVKINATTAPQIATHFNVKSWPTDIILTPSGDELTRMTSIQDPVQYSTTLRQLVWRFRATDQGHGSSPPTQVAQFPMQPPKNTMPIKRPMMGTEADILQNPKTAFGLQPPPNRYADAMGANAQPTTPTGTSPNASQWPPTAPSGAQLATANLLPQAEANPNPSANRFEAHSTYTASPIPAAATGSNVRQVNGLEPLTVSNATPAAPAAPQRRADSQLIMNEFAAANTKLAPTPTSIAAPPAANRLAMPAPIPAEMVRPTARPPLQLPAQASLAATDSERANATGLTATMPPTAAQPSWIDQAKLPIQPTTPSGNAGTASAATYQPSTGDLTAGSNLSTSAVFARAIPPSQPSLAMDGYCPVTLADENQWIKGDRKWGARHRGRIFLFHTLAAQQQFLADPEKYSPLLVGYDPVALTNKGVYEEGKREHGIRYKDQIVMFGSEVALEEFSDAPQQFMHAVYQVMQQPQVRR